MDRFISDRQLRFELNKITKKASKTSSYPGEEIINRKDLVYLINKITSKQLTNKGFNTFIEKFAKANRQYQWIPPTKGKYNIWGGIKGFLLTKSLLIDIWINKEIVDELNMEAQKKTLEGLKYRQKYINRITKDR
jgi:hypothetical protein